MGCRIDVKIIKDVLSAAAQVTVTETWTNTGSSESIALCAILYKILIRGPSDM